ncbi:formate dehydrogenase [Pelomyxa schiedti]|nr:formate dehydrogenase [Pelomyxa schiedti]
MRRIACARDCYDTCTSIATLPVEDAPDDVLLAPLKGDPDHPVTRGFLCARGSMDHKNRITNRVGFPHMRESKDEPLARCSWQNALDKVCSVMQKTIETYGPESVLHLDFAGNAGAYTSMIALRLWNTIGSAATDYTLCSMSGATAIKYHYGLQYGVQPEELLHQKLIVFWGFNPAVSFIHAWALAKQAQRNGTIIVTIDCRKSETASGSDIWLHPAVGTDTALALGIAHFLIKNNMIDNEFITEFTTGFTEYKEMIMQWDLDRVSSLTGIPLTDIESLGKLYASLKPSASMIGLGFQKSFYGAEASRAVSLIPALLGLHRGFFYSNGSAYPVDGDYLTTRGTKGPSKVTSLISIGQAMSKGEFKFIFIFNMNPAVTLPDLKSVHLGLKRSDVFVVVHDTCWTESAQFANVVLPASSFLEKEEVVLPWTHNYVRLNLPIARPLSESRDELWLMREIASRLGITDECITEDPRAAMRIAMKDSLSPADMERFFNGETVSLKCLPKNHYPTPTGKIEFSSQRAAAAGISPVPVQLPIPSRNSNTFVMLNSAVPQYTHSQFQHVYGPIPPTVYINPRDAERLHIANGSSCTLQNDQGSVTLTTRVTDTMPPGVVWCPKEARGTCGTLQNVLTSPIPQTLGGGPTFNTTMVTLAPVVPPGTSTNSLP